MWGGLLVGRLAVWLDGWLACSDHSLVGLFVAWTWRHALAQFDCIAGQLIEAASSSLALHWIACLGLLENQAAETGDRTGDHCILHGCSVRLTRVPNLAGNFYIRTCSCFKYCIAKLVTTLLLIAPRNNGPIWGNNKLTMMKGDSTFQVLEV